MSAAPPRPAQVPSHAEWDDAERRWRAREGARLRRFREDGTLELEGQVLAGVLHGPFRVYNPSGTLAREGSYVEGNLDGIVLCHAPVAPGDAPLRGCCVPPGAARMEARYRAGELRRERFFDAGGRLLLSDGSPCPERPPGLPAHAEFEESTGRWRVGPGDDATDGQWSWYRAGATLDEVARFRDGRRLSRVLHDDRGRPREACEYLLHDGFEDIPHGEFWRRHAPGEPSPYAPPEGLAGAHVVRGRYERGVAVGTWTLEREDGAVLARAERGRPADPRLLAEVCGSEARDGAAWLARAAELRAGGQVREALLACARGAAMLGDAVPFRALCAEVSLPLVSAAALAEAQRVVEQRDDPSPGEGAGVAHGRIARLADALVAGADPPAILCALSVELAGAAELELELGLAELALLLDPERPTSRLARAFALVELGRFDRAAADARALAPLDAEAASFVDALLRALQPGWGFAPDTAGELPALPGDAEVADQVWVAQPAWRVRWAANLYATRLAHLRASLARLCGETAPWLPPVPSWVEPVPLRTEAADIEDEDEDGNLELTRVRIDEAEGLAARGAPGLLRAARASWAALCWLCWAAGQDRAEPPPADADDDAIARARPGYARALNLALQRAFRAHDGLITGGLRAHAQGVPGFLWEDQPVEALPRTLLELAAAEWLEVRAVLLWLTNPGNLSPFQDDLRRV